MQIDLAEAATKLSELILAAERGEEVVLARDGQPIAKIMRLFRLKRRRRRSACSALTKD
jgi:antitoxin (DNA-binding transcriptional repressor) of toxin-antitoxin stability system